MIVRNDLTDANLLTAFFEKTNQIAETSDIYELIEKTLLFGMKLVDASSGLFFFGRCCR